MRRILAVALFALLPASIGAAEEHDVLLSGVAAAAPDRAASIAAAGKDPGGVLSAVAGTDALPSGCGTPLVLLLARPDAPAPAILSSASAIVTARPPIEGEKIVAPRDGHFAIHYAPAASGVLAIDRDRNGSPDLVDRIGEALSAARSSVVGRLGYPSPVAETERLDVYVAELGHGLEGMAIPRTTGANGEAAPFIVLDAGLLPDRVAPAALHQFVHLSLLALAPGAPRWWSEASAAWLTLVLTGDRQAHEAALRARQQSPSHGLAADGLLTMEGTLLWPQFLAERGNDAGIVRQIWEEMATQGLDPAAAADAVLRRSGRTLPDAAREYAAWNLFTGERDDGQHYAGGHAIPAGALPVAPLDGSFRADPIDPVEPLGSVAFRLAGNGGGGTVDLEMTAEGGRPAADLLVFYHAWGPQPVLIPVTFDGAGQARVSLPWADAREAWVVMRNDASAGGASRFDFRALADPYAPYDLAVLEATGGDASIQLEWTTASEKGLAAWNVYRSESPTGPFTRLNDVALPAAGDSSADTGYLYVDGLARRGRRYYYLLEGLTVLGLPQRSHVVSARLP